MRYNCILQLHEKLFAARHSHSGKIIVCNIMTKYNIVVR